MEKEKKEKGNIEVSKNFNSRVISKLSNVFKAIMHTFLLFKV